MNLPKLHKELEETVPVRARAPPNLVCSGGDGRGEAVVAFREGEVCSVRGVSASVDDAESDIDGSPFVSSLKEAMEFESAVSRAGVSVPDPFNVALLVGGVPGSMLAFCAST